MGASENDWALDVNARTSVKTFPVTDIEMVGSAIRTILHVNSTQRG